MRSAAVFIARKPVGPSEQFEVSYKYNKPFAFKQGNVADGQYILPYQKEVKDFYLKHSIQILVALIIFMNFVTAAVQAQILPEEDTAASDVFMGFEWFYVYAFLVELLINMYGHFFWEFWRSGWNWFDFFIVVISLMAIYNPELPALSVLRLFRAFRVIRLFKRVDEMKKIIEGIMNSLPALSYAFIAMGLIMGIWAIMGVDFFGEIESPSSDGSQIKGYFFGSFFKALLSLGQITTFDSWSSGIARDIIYLEGFGAALYFITFIFICGIIMMNVLVALLLDNYLQPGSSQSEGLSPEEAIRQLTTYLQTTGLDVEQFVQYLNEKAFPDFLKENLMLDSLGKSTDIEMVEQVSHKFLAQIPAKIKVEENETVVLLNALARVEEILDSLQETNDQLVSTLGDNCNKCNNEELSVTGQGI